VATSVAPEMPAVRVVAQQVRDEFLHAWRGYRRFAWGYDEVRPVSGTPKNFFLENHSFGLSIVEALDTLYVMELFDGARDLADRLLVCFTKSPSGAPYRYANLHTGDVSKPQSNLAEIGSNILEFGDLTRLTGDGKYLAASLQAYEAVIAKRSSLDLLGTNFDVEKGEYIGSDDVAPDEPADSFYEYLWGGWQMLGLQRCRRWWEMVTRAMLAYKITRVNGRLWFKTVDFRSGLPTGDASLTELSSFYAELVAKGGYRAVGEAFYDSWTAVLDRYELIPEVIFYPDLSIIEPRYWMRPEYPNAAFDLWFLTRDDKYRTTAYRYFSALREHCRVANGYTVLTDVRPRPMRQGDYFPAYSFSENFKYLYLMFSDTPRFNGNDYYLNTEGKILRGLRR
jgi:hypothetical protein